MPIFVAIALFVLLDIVVVAAIVFAVIKGGLGSWARRYPAREPLPDAVRRNFQSFRIGMINLGYSIHVAADEEHLHMVPARLLRWLGARPFSIPWSAVTVKKRSRSGRWTTVMIDRTLVQGPSWCLDLAEPPNPPAPEAREA